MESIDNERVKELLKINRMVYPNPGSDNIESTIVGNYLLGLTDLVDDFVKQDSIICEVGSYRGVSSELFAIFCKKIYCVDIWNVGGQDAILAESHFDEVARNYNNIIKVRKDSTEASADFEDEFFDLIYIDGDHSEEGFRKDLDYWTPKVKSGGVISGHDYFMFARILEDYIDLEELYIYREGSWAYIKD